jgi:murein DD-endopeptidase MepM/ murein hydrolase activator NlpD
MQKELADLKVVLEKQKTTLVQQIADRKRLLKETEGKEANYERIIEITRAELEAIQGIVAGKGIETEVGKVKQGERIANVIIGASPCSTGTHLHFQVTEGGEMKNPLLLLRNINLIDDSGGDPHNASGSWDWPLNEPIKFNQGYGANTSAIRSKIVGYSFHTGIDIGSGDSTVKAVKSGTLYKGGIACGKSTLRYVRVRHDDADADTYYLHVNY